MEFVRKPIEPRVDVVAMKAAGWLAGRFMQEVDCDGLFLQELPKFGVMRIEGQSAWRVRIEPAKKFFIDRLGPLQAINRLKCLLVDRGGVSRSSTRSGKREGRRLGFGAGPPIAV